MLKNVLRIILIYGNALVFLSLPRLAAQNDTAAARRLAATIQLAAEEYRLGVSGGRIIATAEVEEAHLFLSEARRKSAELPATVREGAGVQIDQLLAMVRRTAAPESVAARVSQLVNDLARELGISLDDIPAATPSLARGREVYGAVCAGCHGASGSGDGPAAAGLDPRPPSLTDARALLGSSPLDFYRRITIGVAGTAMAPFEGSLSAEDRWAVALYASTLRLPAPSGEVPEELRLFESTARMSDSVVLTTLGIGASPARLAAVRTVQGSARAEVSSRVFAEVRGKLDSAYAQAEAGLGAEARATAMDAYLTFERVERELRVRDPALTGRIEQAFSSLRSAAGTMTPGELAGIRGNLARALESAERSIVDRISPPNLFLQSLIILLREGLEAILVIGALVAFLVRSGNAHRRRDIHLGVGAALVMSLLTAAAIETIFVLSPSHQEGLEGAIMILAAITLFYVSYWLLSKLEVAKWNRFVKGKMEDALSRGSALTLASVAFLAVYREGFETVLFYKALAVSGGVGAWAPIVLGILLGGGVLAAVYVAVNRFGVRLPLKPLFGVTSALLYYMAFVFAGKAVAELQEAGFISLTPAGWAPRIPSMGIYPTLESLGAQGGLLLLAVVAGVWIFAIAPRRASARAHVLPDAK